MPVAAFVLLLSAAAVVYILLGYPLILRAMPVRPAPSKKDPRYRATVTLIVAVRNGEGHIRAKIETILALDYPKNLIETIIVSDGSWDQTEALVREYSDRGIHLIVAPRGGKAAALNLAIERAIGEILFFTDVRQPLEPSALRHLVANFADPSVGAVTGKLRLLKGDGGEQTDLDLYWRYELWARARQSAIDSIFNTTGCIYAMRRSLAGPLPPDTISDDAVLPLKAFFRGYRVIFDEEAIAVDYPAVPGTEARRRFRNLAGLWQVFVRTPQLFTVNRMRFHFLSHKFSRLMLPWALIAGVVSTIALPSSFVRTGLLALEFAFFLLGFIDRFVPTGFVLKRLSSPARTFLAMNIASLAAPLVFFIPTERLWVQTRVKTSERP